MLNLIFILGIIIVSPAVLIAGFISLCIIYGIVDLIKETLKKKE